MTAAAIGGARPDAITQPRTKHADMMLMPPSPAANVEPLLDKLGYQLKPSELYLCEASRDAEAAAGPQKVSLLQKEVAAKTELAPQRCGQCGSAILVAGAKFCNECGARLVCGGSRQTLAPTGSLQGQVLITPASHTPSSPRDGDVDKRTFTEKSVATVASNLTAHFEEAPLRKEAAAAAAPASVQPSSCDKAPPAWSAVRAMARRQRASSGSESPRAPSTTPTQPHPQLPSRPPPSPRSTAACPAEAPPQKDLPPPPATAKPSTFAGQPSSWAKARAAARQSRRLAQGSSSQAAAGLLSRFDSCARVDGHRVPKFGRTDSTPSSPSNESRSASPRSARRSPLPPQSPRKQFEEAVMTGSTFPANGKPSCKACKLLDFASPEWTGWAVHALANGQLYFAHTDRAISLWQPPTELLPFLSRLASQVGAPAGIRGIWRNVGLFQAAADGDLLFLTLYIGANGNLSARDAEGRPALHYARAAGSEEAVALLLASGADAAAVDTEGLVAADWARRRRSISAMASAMETQPVGASASSLERPIEGFSSRTPCAAMNRTAMCTQKKAEKRPQRNHKRGDEDGSAVESRPSSLWMRLWRHLGSSGRLMRGWRLLVGVAKSERLSEACLGYGQPAVPYDVDSETESDFSEASGEETPRAGRERERPYSV
eukprot:TRINITY_DN34027_c0_g1_i1.p1 TRINITY_DN34027_c0_g1~~TRINITY_DN34027_c0_g1_i1.p1  ORF type:complete len:661 (+),score=107.27 TRINITY_DN34027_c0_g1_i1:110-2092(+)